MNNKDSQQQTPPAHHFHGARSLDPDILHHPAVVKQWQKRTDDAQLRIAGKITTFAGSMNFVYITPFSSPCGCSCSRRARGQR